MLTTRRAHEQGTTRSGPVWTWASVLVAAAFQLLLGVLDLTTDAGPGPLAGWLFLCAGCVLLAQAWWQHTERVHMSSDAAIAVRGASATDHRVARLSGDRARPPHLACGRRQITQKEGEPVTVLVRRSWLTPHDDSIEWNHRLLEQRWHTGSDASAKHSPTSPTRR